MYKKKLSSFHIHFSKCETVFSSQAEILLFMYTALFSAPYIAAWMSFKQLWIDLLYESFWMRSWCFECRPLWRCKSLVSVHISVKIKWSAWKVQHYLLDILILIFWQKTRGLIIFTWQSCSFSFTVKSQKEWPKQEHASWKKPVENSSELFISWIFHLTSILFKSSLKFWSRFAFLFIF